MTARILRAIVLLLACIGVARGADAADLSKVFDAALGGDMVAALSGLDSIPLSPSAREA